MSLGERIEMKDLTGKIFVKVEAKIGEETVTLHTKDKSYIMYHDQSCCENVSLDDIVGNIEDLIGVPILIARESSYENSGGAKSEYDESYTWTFYVFATNKGFVTLKWYGESNGYYSESVQIRELIKETEKTPQEILEELKKEYISLYYIAFDKYPELIDEMNEEDLKASIEDIKQMGGIEV
jgi:hypothetical protein